MSFLTITVSRGSMNQIARLVKSAKGAKEDLGKYETPYERISQKVQKRWLKNFNSDGGIYGSWDGLSPTWTIPDRELAGVGQKTLVRGGRLQDHFVDQNADAQINPRNVQWIMTSAPGAFTVRHHFGYDNPIANREPIPPRKLWDLNEQDEDMIQDEHERYVKKVLQTHFGR